MGWKIHQMGVKTTFLNGVVKEEIYMEKPEGYLQGLGFTKSEVDANLYYIIVGGLLLILVFYVDDLILTGADNLIQDYKADLAREIEMKYIGLMHYFLVLEVWQGDGEIFLGEGKYTIKILKRFHMQDCKPVIAPLVTNWRKVDASRAKRVHATLYRKLMGSLMYLVNMRSDICFAVNQLSQFMVDPTRVHWVVAKHVLKYLRHTTYYGL
eukprot:PITA_04395